MAYHRAVEATERRMVMAAITYSCAMPPGPNCVEYAQLASDLGYDRIWLYDSAALYQDVWVWLARIADRTDIKIGTAVAVPNLRHVMTTASAIATLEHLAPGRLSCGFGTGATARYVLGKPGLSWAATRRYLEQLRALLAGDVVEIDGAMTQMIHYEGWAPKRPIEVPLILSALGPKGVQIARDVADGLMFMNGPVSGFDTAIQMTSGTVLDVPRRMADEPRRGEEPAERFGLARDDRSNATRGRTPPRRARRARDRAHRSRSRCAHREPVARCHGMGWYARPDPRARRDRGGRWRHRDHVYAGWP